jgi:hypothetical protein
MCNQKVGRTRPTPPPPPPAVRLFDTCKKRVIILYYAVIFKVWNSLILNKLASPDVCEIFLAEMSHTHFFNIHLNLIFIDLVILVKLISLLDGSGF